MVSELGGGQPSPAASLADAQQEAQHPVGAVGAVSSVHAPGGPLAAAKQQGTCDAMVVDAKMAGQDPLALRSLSRASSSDLTVPALDPSPGLVSGFVPVSEVGGAAANATPSASLQPQQRQQLSACGPGSSGEDEEEPCSGGQGLGRPVSATGYESGDDMDVLNMQHCTNCTGTLWGHICTDCGHMPAHDLDIFHPTVVSASALHRPRLQGDALTVLCWDERMELHEEAGSSMHPERPDRVRAVMARLQAAELAGRCTRLPAREATPAEVQACHIPELMEAVDMLSEQARLQGNAGLHFSPDTYVNQHTAMCAKLSAGACVDVAAAVVRGEARAGVAVVRPPGHHAESNTAMGFCFYNNAGIAARAAQAAGADRVLVLDWDVHHGNGTQHIFESDPSVLYMSLHRHDGGVFYPGTGAAHEVGQGLGEGYSVNLPWPCGGMRNGDYLAAFQHVVLPIAYEYCPDLVIISAGFDAAEGDPIGGCHLTPECYAHMAAQLQLVAPTVALLEGGYNLLSTARGTEAVVRVLLGERPPQLPPAQQQPCEYGMAAVAQVMRIQARYWGCMRALGQQQLKLLAATAARQEHLAAMKLRRQQAAAADMAAAQAELGLPLGLGADGLEDGLEGEAEEEVGGHMHGSRARPHFRLGRMEGMEEVEADTPHREYRGGSGWESDADLGSDEQPLSQETSDCGSDGAREQRQTDGGGGYGPRNFFASPLSASPLRLAPAEHLASDTDPISDSEAEGEPQQQQQNHWQQYHQQCAGEALASGSLAPSPGGEAAGTVTPAVERLGASASPLTEDAAPLLVQQGCEEQEQQPGSTPGGSRGSGGGAALESPPLSEGAAAAAAAAARWKSLAVPPIVLKRPGQALHQRAVHQRLDPSLAEEAVELLGSMSGPLQQQQEQQQEQPGEERAVPQQEPQA